MDNDFAKDLLETLQPYLKGLDLSGFKKMSYVQEPNSKINARVVGKQIEIDREYFERMKAQIQSGDVIACSNLVNTLHHEFCHIDVDNRMPYLTQVLAEKDIFPKGIAMRVIREFLACMLSSDSMTVDYLKQRQAEGTQEINMLSKNRDIKAYIDNVCDLAYLIGDCFGKPFGYFYTLCNSIEDDSVRELASSLKSVLYALKDKLPIESDSDFEPVCQVIRAGWIRFKESENAVES